MSGSQLAWGALVIAGLFEVGFTTAMSYSAQGRRWGFAAFLVCAIASFSFLQYAVRAIPLGVAYAVWTGIGAVGTLAVSTLVFRQPINAVQIALAIVLVGCVAGLKLSAPH